MEEDAFEARGLETLKREGRSWDETGKMHRRWRATFGASPAVCSILWSRMRMILPAAPNNVEPKHLMWCLLFLKTYVTEHTGAAMVGGVDEDTFRKWRWFFVEAIAFLEFDVVRVQRRIMCCHFK